MSKIIDSIKKDLDKMVEANFINKNQAEKVLPV